MITIQLSEKDLGLLRAGLSAHNIALRHTDPRNRDLMAKADEQRKHGQELSTRLGEAQIEAQKRIKRIIIAVNVPAEDADIHEIALQMDCFFKNADATVWESAAEFMADEAEADALTFTRQ